MVHSYQLRLDQVLGDIIADAENCEDAPALRLRMLEHLRAIASFDNAMIMPLARLGRPTPLAKQRLLADVYRANQARYERELARAHAVGDAQGAYLASEVYGPAERDRLAFESEIIRPQGITSRLVAHLGFRGGTLATLHLCRTGRGAGFARGHLESLRRLVPALGLVYATLPLRPPAFSDVLDLLTAGQRRIVACLRRGLQNKEIAALRHVSPNTVRNELAIIFRKLGVTTRAELAALAERACLE